MKDDTISRQAAIDVLEEIPVREFKKTDGLLDALVSIGQVYRALKQVPSAQQWIPVSERLPETNGRYIVTRGLKACNSIWNRVYIINYSDLMGLIAGKIWWDGNAGKSDFQKIDDVIAWMPVPEVYKGEQE